MAICLYYRTKDIKPGSSKRTMIKGNSIIYLILLSNLVNILFQTEGFKSDVASKHKQKQHQIQSDSHAAVLAGSQMLSYHHAKKSKPESLIQLK